MPNQWNVILNEKGELCGEQAYELFIQGVEVWTAFMEQYPETYVSFRGFDFSQYVVDEINFTRFQFPKGVSFAEVDFGDGAILFLDTVFGNGDVSFENAIFGSGELSFWGAKFSNKKVSFENVAFGDGDVSFEETSFEKTQFSIGELSFKKARFGDGDISFKNVKFGGEVSFEYTSFGRGDVSFNHTSFGNRSDFDNAEFGNGNVLFIGAEFSNSNTSFQGVNFGDGDVLFDNTDFGRGCAWFQKAEFGNGKVSFWNAKFSSSIVLFNKVNFSNGMVSFEGATFNNTSIHFDDIRCDSLNFLSSSFNKHSVDSKINFSMERAYISQSLFLPALDFKAFHNVSLCGTYVGVLFEMTGCEFAQLPDLTVTTINGHFAVDRIHVDTPKDFTEGDSTKARRLKELAKKAEDRKTQLNMLAFELDAMTSTKQIPLRSRFLNRSYKAVSDYGRSIYRPTVALFFVFIASTCFYYFVSDKEEKFLDDAQLSFSQSLPFLSSSRTVSTNSLTALYDTEATKQEISIDKQKPSHNNAVENIGLLQNLLSYMCLFFIGLGIRNRFKL